MSHYITEKKKKSNKTTSKKFPKWSQNKASMVSEVTVQHAKATDLTIHNMKSSIVVMQIYKAQNMCLSVCLCVG